MLFFNSLSPRTYNLVLPVHPMIINSGGNAFKLANHQIEALAWCVAGYFDGAKDLTGVGEEFDWGWVDLTGTRERFDWECMI